VSPFRDLPDDFEAQDGGTGRRPTLSPLRISQKLSGEDSLLAELFVVEYESLAGKRLRGSFQILDAANVEVKNLSRA